LEVRFSKPVDVSTIALELSAQSPVGAAARTVALTTDRGTRVVGVDGSGGSQKLQTKAGLTSRVRLTLSSVSSGPANGFSIVDLSIPGVEPVARLTLPASRETSVDAIVLRDQLPGRSSCLHVGDRPLCRASAGLLGEESSGLRRLFSLPASRTYTFRGEVLPRDGVDLEKLLANPSGISASASSRSVNAPDGRPDAALDRNLSTGWVASESDQSPWLKLSWPGPRRVTGLQLETDQYLAGSRPTSVLVESDSGEIVAAPVDDEGYVRFAPRSTRSLDIRFRRASGVTNIESSTGLRRTLPVGLSELRVLGADDLRRPTNLAQQTGAPCGFGPTLVVDGTSIPTRVEGTVQDILNRQPLRWAACGSNTSADPTAGTVALAAGPHNVVAGPTAEFEPLQMALSTPGAVSTSSMAPIAASLYRSDPSTMRLTVGDRSEDSVLTVAQNFSEGWSARDVRGAPLVSIRVDGWKQGWVLPRGAATVVTARFAPDSTYREGLLVGLSGLLCAAVIVLLSRRRSRRRPELGAPGEAKLPAVVVIGGGAVALVFMSGWAGLVAGVIAGVLALVRVWVLAGYQRSPGAHIPVLRAEQIPVLIPALVMVLGLAAGALAAVQPWLRGSAGLDSTIVQLLTLLAFTIAVGAAFRDDVSLGTSVGGGETSKRRSRRPRLMMGRSINR
ncbi:MAG TPA: discoidin domain-containing protein, partial [Dermatophilaceae bacterium]